MNFKNVIKSELTLIKQKTGHLKYVLQKKRGSGEGSRMCLSNQLSSTFRFKREGSIEADRKKKNKDAKDTQTSD